LATYTLFIEAGVPAWTTKSSRELASRNTKGIKKFASVKDIKVILRS
jgi:hypothetical protein